VRLTRCAFVLLAWAASGAAALPENPAAPAPGLGLALESESGLSGPAQQKALTEIRATGVNVFALPMSWSEIETAEGKYDFASLAREARFLRQSGATLHVDLPMVAGRRRDMPPDLERLAFDDPRLVQRVKRFLTALEPLLLDVSTLSLGYGADAYFADKKEELTAFRRLCDAARASVTGVAPQVLVGVTTASPTESAAPDVAAALQVGSPVLFYIYSPFQRGNPFVHRPPDALDHDWKRLLERSDGRPIAFSEVSYSSSRENGSSLEWQADFVRRMRRFVAAADGRRLLFARYAAWRDAPAARPRADAPPLARRRAAFESNRGLLTADGRSKPAWAEWVAAGKRLKMED
jgi:hypothetical protein